MKQYLLIPFAFLFNVVAIGQIQHSLLLTKTPRQYEKAEWNIQLRGVWTNPYLEEEVTLDMHLISPSGKSLVLPCYFESGASGAASAWKARFNPQQKGKYHYVFVLSQKGTVVDSSRDQFFTAGTSGRDGILHVKDNWVLTYDSGKPFRGIGENIGWESRANDDSKFFKELHERPKYNYEYMLPSLARHGGNFFRTWVSRFNLPLDWKSGFNSKRYEATTEYFNPSAIAKLDRLVNLCDSLHLHMMLTLGQGAYNKKEGGYASSAADFFVNPQAKQQYKNRLRYFVARWGYSAAIGAWEFFNEVDNVQFSNRNNPINPADISQWHDEMSTYLKALDPYEHIVTTSISHRDIQGMNSLKNLDLNQKHIYKNTRGIPAEIARYETDFGKPYVIGEYSYEWDWSKDFNQFSAGMDSDFKRGLWYGLFSPTPVLPLSWWWEYFDDRGTDAYLSKIRKISDRMLAAGKGAFQKIAIADSVPGAVTYAVQCGPQVFVYVFNPSDTAVTARIHLTTPASLASKAMVYEPEADKWSKLEGIKKQETGSSVEALLIPAGTDKVLVLGEVK